MIERPSVLEHRGPATYLGSGTAPDGVQVRQRLRVIEEQSLRRKNATKRLALGVSLVALALMPGVVLSSSPARGPVLPG
jgi:hypothetical protein